MKTAARLPAHGAAVVLFGAGASATGMTVDAPTDHLRPSAESGPASGYGDDHGGGGHR